MFSHGLATRLIGAILDPLGRSGGVFHVDG
jgi:hypothetical protein